MKITDILKDTNYKLTQFNTTTIQELESRIFVKEVKGKNTLYKMAGASKRY